MEEIWKDIKGYEGLYEVSNLGRVRSYYIYNKRVNKKAVVSELEYKILKPVTLKLGYKRVILVKDKVKKRKFVHRLVADAFLPNLKDLPLVNHIDSNLSNNVVDNLEWCTAKENMEHCMKYGNYKNKGRKIMLIEEGYIFNNRKEIKEYFKVKYDKEIYDDLITRCCNGKRKTAYGFTWKYISQ